MNTAPSDPISTAIRNLHISVIPANLPGREKEQNDIERFIEEGIKSNGSYAPLYISGMPG